MRPPLATAQQPQATVAEQNKVRRRQRPLYGKSSTTMRNSSDVVGSHVANASVVLLREKVRHMMELLNVSARLVQQSAAAPQVVSSGPETERRTWPSNQPARSSCPSSDGQSLP